MAAMASSIAALTPPKLFRRLLQLPPAVRCSYYSHYSPASTTAAPEIYDVVCVGGGPAGLSLISALRAHPSTRRLKVALIDGQNLTASRPASETDTYSNRCSSLTPASLKFLKAIGAWERIDGQRVQDYHGMEVWDGVSGAKITFDPLDARRGVGGGTGVLDSLAELIPGSRFRESRRRDDGCATDNAGVVATMCENANLTSALLRGLETEEIWDKTTVESIQLGAPPESDDALDLSQWPIVALPGSRRLAARLLVGADGANSPVRNFADIPSDGWDYNQHGVVATLTFDHTFAELDLRFAYQRFLPTGPIALLPLPGNKASLVWSISTPLASKLKSLSPSDLTHLVNAAFRLEINDLSYFLTHAESMDIPDELSWRLQNTPSRSTTGLPHSLPQVASIQDGSVASFPLRMRHASTYTTHRVALIGDAAHTIHPLAGQGLNLGLADSQSLADHIIHGIEHGMDIGTSWCLDGYTSARWAANNAVMGVCDKLQKLYGVSSGPVVWARSAGLGFLERMGPVKGMVMRAAAGTR